ncbi:chromosome segregation protein SMC [Convivina intestini]|uniref:Chromosome partition protein Smc n=1 Tax=Convivina intestini TaxID=1505726 RepID=A0A2U1DC70_9LACO|nr:chromosome segregation protein SMC [Convivina intestini]PVY85268.1 condensin subunit Smc [Convivina intestini]CAH1852685.1 Chromosome partition protein Smc [Convivina intestini]SDB86951.1 condensin subunit Smc [Leuconostocaceae bacterium R-53105]
MKLKTLEISGFKSFADKTVIDFMPGMTGIVGPNGSGKSNIIEAIRWVMGEQSAKDLRGNKMSDVIFAGTKKRRGLNRAEVAITFDNSDHYVKSDYTEIRITRRLYRTGESVYQLNGSDCRLRDIHELFMDTGLGREGFSIISQGRVESIFNAKPEDRRGIIEEVAGVYKYKQNKHKAQQDLAQTQLNLDRLYDIITEVQNQLEPLEKQATVAHQYLKQREEYEQLDQQRLCLELSQVNEQLQQRQADLSQQNQDLEKAKGQLAKRQAELENSRQEQVNLQQERDSLQTKLVAGTQQKERLIASQQLAEQKLGSLERENQQLSSQAQHLSQTLQSKQADLKALQQQISVWQEQKTTLSAKITEIDQAYGANRLKDLERQLENHRHTYIQTLQNVANLHNTYNYQVKNQTQLDHQINQQSKDIKVAQDQLNQAQTALAQYQANHPNQPEGPRQNWDEKIQQLTQTLQDLQKKYQTLTDQWRWAQRQLETKQSRYEAMKALDDYAGFYQGVRNLMAPKVRQQFTGIKGVVAELMTVPSPYTLAVETVLGGALQQIVVDSTGTAKQIVRYLTQKRLGRVTILPLDTIRSRQIRDLQVVSQLDGFVGLAADLVTMPSGMDNIKSSLLGTTVVAENLDAATKIAQKGQHRFRVVSLDGQLVNAGGSITGGANQRQGHTLLSRQAQLQELTQSLENEQDKFEQLTAQRDACQQAGIQAQQTLADAKQEQQEQENQVNQTDYELSRKEDACQQHQRLVHGLEQELANLKEQQSQLAEQIQVSQTDWQNAQAQQAEQEVATEKLNQQLAQLNQDLEGVNQQRNQYQNELVAVQTRLESAQSDSQRLQAELSQLQEDQTALQQRQAQLETAVNHSQNALQVEAELAAIQQELEQVQAAIQIKQDDWTQLLKQLKHVEEQLSQQQDQLNQKMSQLSQMDLALKQTQRYQDGLTSDLLSQYGIQANQDLTVYQTKQSLGQLKEQLHRLKSALNQLGSVNIGAIDEYQSIQERYDFLTQQRDDLQSAQATLKATISEMDHEVESRFKATFETVAQHFEVVFKQIFGGGQAKISLTDPKELLTTGIDITAQPPGKKFQHMSLLSGGEKALTAISLLFAILQVRPVPFVVLDEAEAALDEANVDRFAHYLKSFGGSTQFITITHRKGTMANANILYGVTMQEAGVSKMVAVDLDQIHQ